MFSISPLVEMYDILLSIIGFQLGALPQIHNGTGVLTLDFAGRLPRPRYGISKSARYITPLGVEAHPAKKTPCGDYRQTY